MKKLRVIYAGWDERFELGVLADDGNELIFEYSTPAIKRGLELSPFKLPLSTQAYGDFPDHQHRLPGMLCDALPDGWGMLLMDRLFRANGRNPSQISPLERLAFIGDQAMGALAFEPAERESLTPETVSLLELAQSVQSVLEGDSEALLLELALMGGSPHGARPKVLVTFDRVNNQMSTAANADGDTIPMLIKFPAQNEHKEVCAIEAMYAKIAQACDINMPEAQYFDLNSELSAFGVERFDREGKIKIPIHTAAGAAHVDFRVPQLDYIALLRLTKLMTRDIREVHRAYERCVFNVVFNNRDDHSKNFSFLMSRDGQWQVSPAYDLTFCEGPNGEHQMDICGEARAPSREDLLKLANKGGLLEQHALESIDRICTVSRQIRDFGNDFPIRKDTMNGIIKNVDANCARLK